MLIRQHLNLFVSHLGIKFMSNKRARSLLYVEIKN
jgi:hypothetical protein